MQLFNRSVLYVVFVLGFLTSSTYLLLLQNSIYSKYMSAAYEKYYF